MDIDKGYYGRCIRNLVQQNIQAHPIDCKDPNDYDTEQLTLGVDHVVQNVTTVNIDKDIVIEQIATIISNKLIGYIDNQLDQMIGPHTDLYINVDQVQNAVVCKATLDVTHCIPKDANDDPFKE